MTTGGNVEEEVQLVQELIPVVLRLHAPSVPGEVLQSSPGHMDLPFYGRVCDGDWGSELSISPLPTAHHLHPDILDQLFDAVVPPIHPFLQQLLVLQLDAMPQFAPEGR